MAAKVEKRPNNAFGVPPYDDRIFPDIRRAEITRPGNLALMAQIHPTASKEHPGFLFVDLRIDKDGSADEASVGVHETIDIYIHFRNPNPLAVCAGLGAEQE
jgi:hypothetical protein